jgi:hypothetical protein
MSDWISVKGIVKPGYGVASGQASTPRFPQGTLAMQKPFFQAMGLDLDAYFLGTINLAIAPHTYQVQQAKYTFLNLKWSPQEPAEDFSFFDCRIQSSSDHIYSGLIYYPHPETKPEHFQAPDILEIIAPMIQGLRYGDELILSVDPQQIKIDRVDWSSHTTA